jgi:ACS family allantoate permease-like MFS transporter
VPAEITIVVVYGVCLVDLAFIWWWYNRQNKRKALIRASAGYVKLENQEYVDEDRYYRV